MGAWAVPKDSDDLDENTLIADSWLDFLSIRKSEGVDSPGAAQSGNELPPEHPGDPGRE